MLGLILLCLLTAGLAASAGPLATVIDTGAAPLIEDGVDFGTDSSPWANDGECDDPRFSGPGMTTTSLLDSDIRADASDCAAAWRAGELTLLGDEASGAAVSIRNRNAPLLPAPAPVPAAPAPKERPIAN